MEKHCLEFASEQESHVNGIVSYSMAVDAGSCSSLKKSVKREGWQAGK